jgi:HSP20 family protein
VTRLFLERRDMDDEVRRLFDRLTNAEQWSASAECTPPIDVFDTPDGIEVVIDLPGVAVDQIQVVIARNTLVVMGQKATAGCEHQHEAAFHVAERGFGRFARGVRLAGAFDVGRAAAMLHDGELRVTLPRIEERRGRERRIPVRTP